MKIKNEEYDDDSWVLFDTAGGVSLMTYEKAVDIALEVLKISYDEVHVTHYNNGTMQLSCKGPRFEGKVNGDIT